ncbi:elongation factor P maturation arginine rhamnosyltransferase EarP [Serpentinimonas barnesii]|uniref:elongation factor P maturation arginine rhamnosyltransferase EarP n=1 Tax=Serpentinimonas barnesii TaxID=1458427 RepID=UPI0009E5BE01|nr:elongation factor P maturation arginine rhamnosyltransferase EarP [Serpentinimonas barnesii]
MSPAESLHATLAAPTRPPEPPCAPLLWDIFCHVIDNWGDLGVCWRLARQLAQRGQRVRLWADDASALAWMAPRALQSPSHGQPGGHLLGQGELAGLRVYPWPRQQPDAPAPAVEPGDVLIEAFGCHIEPHWVQALQPEGRAGQVWLNLEYLSAEPWAERCHGLPSPVLSGPLVGRCKWFYYPGFTAGSGGLLREIANCPAPEATPSSEPSEPSAPDITRLQILLFCYQAPALPALLADPALAQAHWLLTAGRAQAAWQAAWSGQPDSPAQTTATDANTNPPPFPAHSPPTPQTTLLPLLAQTEFDALLRTCHLNLVRGEDSLVSALWAGQPLLWQLYPQHDGAHLAKLDAFLDWLDAPPCLRQWHRVWNGVPSGAALPPLTVQRLQTWRHCILAARQRLLQQADLVSQLLGFVAEKR